MGTRAHAPTPGVRPCQPANSGDSPAHQLRNPGDGRPASRDLGRGDAPGCCNEPDPGPTRAAFFAALTREPYYCPDSGPPAPRQSRPPCDHQVSTVTCFASPGRAPGTVRPALAALTRPRSCVASIASAGSRQRVVSGFGGGAVGKGQISVQVCPRPRPGEYCSRGWLR